MEELRLVTLPDDAIEDAVDSVWVRVRVEKRNTVHIGRERCLQRD